MGLEAIDDGVRHEIEEALARQAVRCRRLIRISRADSRKHGRAVYRAELDDGRTIKVRRLESAEAARRLFALRSRMEPAFAPAIAHHELVLLEAWVEGSPLSEHDTEARAGEAGALLARLHAMALDGAPPTVSTRAWRDRAATELDVLREAGVLGSHAVASLAAMVRRHDPEIAPAALVHRDFCAENMLIDRAGYLRVIDNEWQSIGPAAYDLGRTFSRWPMSRPAWRRFLGGYRSTARVDPGPLAFWKIVAALKSTCIRLHEEPERLEVPLAVLHRLSERPLANVASTTVLTT